METRLLVLGAGRHQKDLIRRAEQRGIRVVVADYYPDSPGKSFATYSTMVSWTDVDACMEIARKFDVSGVITTGTDQAVVTMAAIADRLGLPCYLSPRSAGLATDKLLMKRAFHSHGLSEARHIELGLGDEIGNLPLRYPIVVKPCDAQGQRGVQKVSDAGMLPAAAAMAFEVSRVKKVLVEEFVEGREVTISAWIDRGEAKVLMITDRVTYNPLPSLGICFQHIFPSLWAAGLTTDLRDITIRLARAFEVASGPLYVQAIVSERGIFLVEASCRVGGGHENRLIPMVTGVDVTDRLIDLALGLTPVPIDYDYDEGAIRGHALVNFLLPRPGTIAVAEGFSALRERGLLSEGEFYHGPGFTCEKVLDGNGRVGYFIAEAASRQELLDRAQIAYRSLILNDDRGSPMLFQPVGDAGRAA
jgi:biotin carboxylase